MPNTSLDSTDGHPDTDVTGTLSPVRPDEAFRALADQQRCAALTHLHERPNEAVPVESLAGALTHDESESDQRRIAAALATVQLPKLDACGVVDYDREQRTVRYLDSRLVNGLLARLHG